ncbi:hypothetical protein BB559_005321 [Furculomyces boomerangus]|uniref:Major facilitator superfamily (MFS) profile domain-containing protein n=1 Tax=Furculomyces boomerangus TaxID=61424 RepID=A0A2T9Y9D9_9FUNG|nr:hypothetical protein BB559_005321 [Furculomyces boomerangus]
MSIKSAVIISNLNKNNEKDTRVDLKEVEGNIKNVREAKPLDTGYAWLVMASGILNFLVLFGNFNAFGVFQEYYLNTVFKNNTAASISWISTISFTFTLSGGIMAGPIMSYLGVRKTALLGSILSSLGILLASFSKTIPMLVLTQGLIYGIGASIIINICLVMPAIWFQKYRHIAISLIAGGGGYGSLILTPTIAKTLKSYGIAWSFRVLFILNVVSTGLGVFVFKENGDFKPLRRVIDLKLLKNRLTLLFCLGGFVIELGYAIPALYFAASVREIGESRQTSSNMLLIFSATSGTGRVLGGFLSKKFGANTTLIFTVFATGILVFALWLPTKIFTMYIVFIVLYGFTCPLYFSLTSLVISNVYKKEEVSQVNGLVYIFYGISSILGIPLYGVLLDKAGNRTSYKPLIIFCGSSYLLAGVVLVLQRRYFRKNIESMKTGKI